MGDDMTKIFGVPKTMVMIQTKDGRFINLGECKIESEPIARKEEPDYKSLTDSMSFSVAIEPTGDLMRLFGETPRGKTYDYRKAKPTKADFMFRSVDRHRCPTENKEETESEFCELEMCVGYRKGVLI